jgi:tRNA A37 threonylcarbamoyladenosine biosynthesis protein TsaE
LPELPVHLLQVALRSPEAMELLGASLGQDAEPGDVVLLMG